MHDLAKIFLSYYVKEFERIRRKNINLAHYTHILSGYSILKKKEIWLRNITKMNDNMEVKWGLELFKIFLYDNNNLLYNKLLKALARAHKDVNYWKLIIDEMIDNFYETYAENTYILSLTEWDNKNVNNNLFNTFCRDEGMIVIFNINSDDDIGKMLNLSRVAYFNGLEFKEYFIKFIESIEKNTEFIKKYKLEDVKELFKQAIFYAILSIKHPCFIEENEWRVVYCSKFGNYGNSSNLIVEDNVEIKGGLEKVYKINLNLLSKHNLLSNIISAYNQNYIEELLQKEIKSWNTFDNEKFIEYKVKKEFVIRTNNL